jgi:hypothetical protein
MANVDFAFILVKSGYLDGFLQASSCGWILPGGSRQDFCQVSVPLDSQVPGKLEGSYQLAEISVSL